MWLVGFFFVVAFNREAVVRGSFYHFYVAVQRHTVSCVLLRVRTNNTRMQTNRTVIVSLNDPTNGGVIFVMFSTIEFAKF